MTSINKEKWQNWDDEKAYGDLFFKRATGQSPEMESSKSVSRLLKKYYTPGMSLLDVGCGVGHYLRSLKNILDENITYTGVDYTEYYVELAKEAFGNSYNFLQGDIRNLPFNNDTFDIVMNNNVLMHLPPDLTKPISELVRVSKKYIVIRTMFGKRNYVIREILSENDLDANPDAAKSFDYNLENNNYRYFNMFTEDYYLNLINAIDSKLKVQILEDKDWKSFDNVSKHAPTGTRTLGEFQVSGNLILDWRYIIIEK